MKVESVVVSASPLIILFKSGLADLLPRLFSEVAVTEGVWKEVAACGEAGDAPAGVGSAAWLRRVPSPRIAPRVAAWNLGDGEAEVLSFAFGLPGYRAMVDDRAARRCARTLGVGTLGTGGVLVLAKRGGLITSVSDELRRLKGAGLWLSEELEALLKGQAGES